MERTKLESLYVEPRDVVVANIVTSTRELWDYKGIMDAETIDPGSPSKLVARVIDLLKYQDAVVQDNSELIETELHFTLPTDRDPGNSTTTNHGYMAQLMSDVSPWFLYKRRIEHKDVSPADFNSLYLRLRAAAEANDMNFMVLRGAVYSYILSTMAGRAAQLPDEIDHLMGAL
jgi:hypothetical protein